MCLNGQCTADPILFISATAKITVVYLSDCSPRLFLYFVGGRDIMYLDISDLSAGLTTVTNAKPNHPNLVDYLVSTTLLTAKVYSS